MENTILIQPAELDAEARAALAPLAGAKLDTSGGLRSVDDLVRGGQLFEISRDGVVIGRYALRVDGWAHGREGVILAAVGDQGEAFTERVLPLVERQFIDVQAVTVYTRRMGLVKRLARQGYGVGGFILRKPLHAGGRA